MWQSLFCRVIPSNLRTYLGLFWNGPVNKIRWTRQTAFQGVRLIKMGNYTLSWQCEMAGGWLWVRHDTWGNWSPLWHNKEGAGAPIGWCSSNCTMHTLLRKHDMLFTGVPRKCEMSALLPEWICAQHPCPLTKWNTSHPSAIQDKSHCRYIVNNTWKKCSAHTSHFAHRNGTK